MKQVNALHQLIHSLSPAEKRYFKLYAKTQGKEGYKKQYEKLFDALNAWESEYDEDVFKKKHHNKAFLRNFSFNKHHLYELILKSCIQVNQDKNNQLFFLAEMQETEFLAGKKLKQQYLDKLNTVFEKAKARNNYVWELMLQIRKYNLYRPQTETEINTVYTETNELLRKIQRYVRMQYITRRMAHYANREIIIDSPAQLQKMEALYEEAKSLLNEEQDTSTDIWIGLVYSSQFFLGHTQHKDAIPFSLSALEQMERSERNNWNEVPYSMMLANTLKIIATYYPREHYTLFYEILARLKKIKYKTVSLYHEAYIFISTCVTELHLLMVLKQFEKCDPVIKDFYADYEQFEKHIVPEDHLRLLINLSEIAIYRKQYTQAQQCIKEALQVLSRYQNVPLELNIRLLSFMGLALSGEYDKLDSALLALQRFGKRNALDDELYHTILQLCKAAIKTGSLKSNEVKNINKKLQEIPHSHTDIKEVINEWVG